MYIAAVTFMLAYVIGSFPTAYLIGRLNHINIFEVGSGNMGANNVIRTLGWKWGIFVWAVDSAKGVLAVMLARLLPGDVTNASVIAAIAVVVGHNWSLLATMITGTLRGGKGAATAAGTWIIMMLPWPHIVVITLSLWGILVLVTRYVSLAVLVSVAIGTVWVIILMRQDVSDIPQGYIFYIVAVALMIYVRHWDNIQRLLKGRERRLGERV